MLRIRTLRKDSRIAPIAEPHTAVPPMDIQFNPSLAHKSFPSRIMTRFRVWRSRFRRKDREQVAHPQMTESRVSDTFEAVELELDEYLATPTALPAPSFSVRSSIRSGVVDDAWVFDLGADPGRVTDTYTSELGSLTSSGALGLEGLPRLRMVDADGVLPTSSSPGLCAPRTQLEDTPSTNGCLTLSRSPVPLTPLDREVSLVDPFDAVRAYANGGRSPLAGISGFTRRIPVLDVETIKHAEHPMTSPAICESDVALRALAAGYVAIGVLQRSPSPDPPLPSDERYHDPVRGSHIQLAATSLERGRQTVRVPANTDLGYLRFREVLRLKLMVKGDECIWRGLEMRDKSRL